MKIIMRRLSAMLLIFLMIISFVFISHGYELPHYTKDILYTESNWVISVDDETFYDDIKFPLRWKADETKKITLSTTLTYNPSSQDLPCAFVSFNHMYCKIFLDDKEVYNYTPSTTTIPAKAPGDVYAIAPLDDDCTGKELRIEIFPTLENGIIYTLNEISFGDFTTVLRSTFTHDLPRIILTITVSFCGFALLILSLFISSVHASKQLWHIGLFSVLFSIYSTTESLFFIYMVSNPYFMHLLNFFTFALLPIPLLCFYYERTGRNLHKLYYIFYLILIGNVILQAVLHFTGICDLSQSVTLTHALYTCTLILIPISIFFMKDIKQKRFLTIETIFLLTGAILDALGFYKLRIFMSNTAASQAAVLIVLFMEGFEMLRNMRNAQEENIKSKFYKELAYKDALTNLKNRVAFNKDIEEIKSGVYSFNTMMCMSVDVNGLKTINDSMGHASGDILIKKTADFLTKYFSSFSSIYRLGGDEFVLLLYDIDEDYLTTVLKNMTDEIDIYNENASVPVKFAFGYTKYDGENLEDCIRSADHNMYKHKSEMGSDEYTPRSIPNNIQTVMNH